MSKAKDKSKKKKTTGIDINGNELPATSFFAAIDITAGPDYLRDLRVIGRGEEVMSFAIDDPLKYMSAAMSRGVLQESASGVYTIQVRGFLHRKSYWANIGMEDFCLLCHHLDAQSTTNEIQFWFASSGGTAEYMHHTAAVIRDLTAKTTAYIDEHACSAALNLAVQCNKVVVTPVSRMGSVGVISYAYGDGDAWSKPIVTVSRHAPRKYLNLKSKDGLEQLQESVDHYEDIMIKDIAAGRNVTEDYVIEHFGKGGVIYGADLVTVGLADECVDTIGINKRKDKKIFMSDENKNNGKRVITKPKAVLTPEVDEIETAVNKERERVCNVLSAYGLDLPEELTAHLRNGDTPGDVAIATVKRLKSGGQAIGTTAKYEFNINNDPLSLNKPLDISTPLSEETDVSEQKAKETDPLQAAEAAWEQDPKIRAKYRKKDWYLGAVLGADLAKYKKKGDDR